MPYFVVTLGMSLDDNEDIQIHLEKLEEMGYTVNLDYEGEDED